METQTVTSDTTPELKPRKKRVWTDEQRKAMSKRVKRQWKLKKQGNGGNGSNGDGAKSEAPAKSASLAPMAARLTAYGVNPNTGAVELLSQDLGTTMTDLVPNLLALLYNGTVMTEIRLEQR